MKSSPPFSGYVLGAEALALGITACMTGTWWLLPLAATCALLSSIALGYLATGLLVSLGTTAVWGWTWTSGMAQGSLATVHPITALLVGSSLAFISILTGLKQRSASPILGCLTRLAVFLHFLTAGLMLGSLYLQGSWQLWIAIGYALVTVILSLDTLLRLLARLYTPRRHWAHLPAPGAFFFYRLLGPEWKSCLPSPAAKDEGLELKLAEMWMWPTVRRSLPSLIVTILAIVWLLTCIHELPMSSQGLRQHLGSWEKMALAPGLHGSLPWPLGGIRTVETDLMREVVLGFRADPGQPILWEKAHYEDEQKSLVGGGDDFLSISVPVFYRVQDAALFLRSSDDPEGLLRSLAQRVLLNLTLRLPAREIMTGSRESLRHQFQRDLQDALDASQSGLVLVNVYLRDIHPPVGVAPAFQEVISALEEKEALLHEGEAYRRDVLSRSQGDAKAILVTAQSNANNRIEQVKGQASRFDDMLTSWKQATDLYQWREGFRVLDETLSGAKKAIFDASIRGEMPTHIDLRKVLNPDFVDTVPPRPQSLVPRPSKSMEAFDLDIEGYLRADQGDVPAPDFTPSDADNLLKTDSGKPLQPELSQP